MKWDYLFKHWFGTLFLGPVISQTLMYLDFENPNKIVGPLEIYPIALLFSLLFSIPTYFIYCFAYYYLASKKIPAIYAKAILILLSVSGVIATTIIIKGTWMFDIGVSYSISSVITGCFFKLNFENPNNKK